VNKTALHPKKAEFRIGIFLENESDGARAQASADRIRDVNFSKKSKAKATDFQKS
jgi:hypothetical protein